ncbi:MAG: methyltransferase domain-containing protein [Chloroflexi bacterium]|nr:methyltransferase domain-containing protein [Chloroflexota bacterium]
MQRAKGYDRIAESWYHRRHYTRFRRELDELAARWSNGRLINLGCAHGPDFLPFARTSAFELYGLDSSREMLRFARRYMAKHGFEAELVAADARYLPFINGTFAWAVAVAVYHNIKGAEARASAFGELLRVLKPGAEAFVTVWNRWQPRFWFHGREVLVPWRTRSGDVRRYYHLFSRSELTGLFQKAGFEVLRVFPEKSHRFPIATFSRNICVLARKPL